MIPDIERSRIGLAHDTRTVSHLILDDFNKVRPDSLYDFESLEPVGCFSARFLEKVARRFLNAMRDRHPIYGLARR